MLSVELIPIFKDNYVFLIIDSTACEAIVVDPGEAAKTIQVLRERNLKLIAILITHHHADHIDGLEDLRNEFEIKPEVFAPEKNKNQIPHIDQMVRQGSVIHVGSNRIKITVTELPGHTLGHVGYYFQNEAWLFSGDVLFGLGCGRLFEGTFEQAFQSLQWIKSLPTETKVYCTHEYTEVNFGFCQSLLLNTEINFKMPSSPLESYGTELKNKRSHDVPSVPLLLRQEIQTNPFLLAQSVQQFSELRRLRNVF